MKKNRQKRDMKMCFFTISDKKIELTGGDGVLCVGMLEEMNYFE